MLSVYNDLVRAVDSKMVTALVLLDLSSAFNTVDHSTLLTVLDRRFGVRESAMDWLSSYLSGQTDLNQNVLPSDLHDITDTSTFRKRLKNVLFDHAFN